VLLLCAWTAAVAEEYSYHYQRIVETGTGIKFDLTYVSGNLQITGNDLGMLTIEAVKNVNAVNADEAEEVQAHIEIRVEESKDRVRVSTNYLRMQNRSRSFWQKVLGLGGSDSYGDVDWVITVPDNCDITVSNISGMVEVRDVRGAFTIRSSASDVTLSSIKGPVSIETSSAMRGPASDITLSSIEGPIVIKTSSGKTSGELLFGDVEVRQPRGEIDLKWVEGDIRIKSSSAKIDIRQERGGIDLTTATGSVSIQTSLDDSRGFFVETESGSINLLIPETASGILDIKSETGEIRSEIPISIKSLSKKQVVGEFGYGGVTISLSSVTGDVTVAQF